MQRDGEDAALVLHLGLPKTATTFLQYAIFKHAPDLIYVHKAEGPQKEHTARLVRRYTRVGEEELADKLAAVKKSLAKVHQEERTQGRTTLISDENISLWPIEVWEGTGPTPALVAARTAMWARSEVPHQSIRVILGVRRQDQWLASRYAQSAPDVDEPGQTDFEKRTRELWDGDLHGCMQWLDYAEARRQLEGALGEGSVFVAPMESLEADPRRVLERMGDFLGGVPLADTYNQSVEDPRVEIRRNVTSTGPNTWKLRGSDATITLSESHSNEIRERFKDSNEELAEAIGVDLHSLGYW